MARIDSMAQAEVDSDTTASVAIGVMRGADVVLARGYGQADLELDVPATGETVYRIGFITKQFTSTAIMQLTSSFTNPRNPSLSKKNNRSNPLDYRSHGDREHPDTPRIAWILGLAERMDAMRPAYESRHGQDIRGFQTAARAAFTVVRWLRQASAAGTTSSMSPTNPVVTNVP